MPKKQIICHLTPVKHLENLFSLQQLSSVLCCLWVQAVAGATTASHTVCSFSVYVSEPPLQSCNVTDFNFLSLLNFTLHKCMFRFPYVLLNCVSKRSILLRKGIREQLVIWQQALFVEFLYSCVALRSSKWHCYYRRQGGKC